MEPLLFILFFLSMIFGLPLLIVGVPAFLEWNANAARFRLREIQRFANKELIPRTYYIAERRRLFFFWFALPEADNVKNDKAFALKYLEAFRDTKNDRVIREIA